MQLDDWDKILNDVALDETKEEYADEWFCSECEHGPMNEKDDKCTRCGAKSVHFVSLIKYLLTSLIFLFSFSLLNISNHKLEEVVFFNIINSIS